MQKKFIWSNQTSSEPGRHKISPHLLFIPKTAGGLGLISILVAIHTLAVKEATMWLLEPNDRYTQAWRNWCKLIQPGNTNFCVSPCRANSLRKTRGRGQKVPTVHHHLSRSLGPSQEETLHLKRYVGANLSDLGMKCSTQFKDPKVILYPGDQVQVHADLEAIDWQI